MKRSRKRKGSAQESIFDVLESYSSEELYSHAYHWYNSGKCQKASYLFRHLLGRDAENFAYIIGLAGCFHRMKLYQSAADLYNVAATVDSANPTPLFYAADCLIHLEDFCFAMANLGAALKRCEANSEYDSVKQQITLMMDGVKEKVEVLTR